MEPTSDKPCRWRFHTHVVSVSFREEIIRTDLDLNGKPFSTQRPIGWFALFEGSHESIYLGATDPDLKPGDRITITIEKDSK